MRFFAGEIIEDTVRAVAVGPHQKLVDMAPPPEAEHEASFFIMFLLALSCPSVHLSVCPSIRPSVRLPSARLPVCLSLLSSKRQAGTMVCHTLAYLSPEGVC